jgi:hypothetical protein
VCTDLLFFGYFSPEVLLPATSIVATIVGVFMMLGRGSIRNIIRLCRRASLHRKGTAATSRPHFRVRDSIPADATRE